MAAEQVILAALFIRIMSEHILIPHVPVPVLFVYLCTARYRSSPKVSHKVGRRKHCQLWREREIQAASACETGLPCFHVTGFALRQTSTKRQTKSTQVTASGPELFSVNHQEDFCR